MNDELASLFVSGKEIDKKLVAEILSPYLKIDIDTCDIRPLKTWGDLKAYIKILLYLVARKAMAASDYLPEESASATEIMQNTGLKKGTVNPSLRGLFSEDRLVEQTKERRYYIPNHALEQVKVLITENTQ